MNWSEHTCRITGLLNDVRRSETGSRELFVEYGKVCIGELNDKRAKAVKIAKITRQQINLGLSANEWQRIETRIRDLCSKGVLK